MSEKINVTKTFLPPQREYQDILERAWSRGWMTNRGVLVTELESKLKEYLKISNVIVMTNGTLPIQIAIKALNLSGEIITPAFSYVATTSSIVWEGCEPVFVDMHPDYFTIDERLIEDAITENTTAILGTHVFGNPCEVDAIQKIADKHGLRVIYDAAHCFAVDYKGKSVFEYGDVSTCSFHATKLFHTGEGGALFFEDSEMYETFFYHHNFGHKGKEEFQGLGINAKMSEPQAALGLSIIPYLDNIIEYRAKVVSLYSEELSEFSTVKIREGTNWNYSYFPIILESEAQLKRVQQNLNDIGVYPRRYFYPSLNLLPYCTGQSCKVSEKISRQILCLPLYYNLPLDKVVEICLKIKEIR